MAFVAVVLAAVFAWCLVITVSGELPDRSPGRMLGMVLIMAAVLALGLWCVASVRGRVVIGEDGLDIVGAFSRRHLPWDRVTGMWVNDAPMRPPFRVWELTVRTSGGEEKVLMVPVLRIGGPDETERHHIVPQQAPRRLRKQFGWLYEAWQRHRVRAAGDG